MPFSVHYPWWEMRYEGEQLPLVIIEFVELGFRFFVLGTVIYNSIFQIMFMVDLSYYTKFYKACTLELYFIWSVYYIKSCYKNQDCTCNKLIIAYTLNWVLTSKASYISTSGYRCEMPVTIINTFAWFGMRTMDIHGYTALHFHQYW